MEKYEAIAWLADKIDQGGAKNESDYRLQMVAAEIIVRKIYQEGGEISLKNGTK